MMIELEHGAQSTAARAAGYRRGHVVCERRTVALALPRARRPLFDEVRVERL
jgi:hypothetical protein